MAKGDLPLSPQHGVNPSLMLCWYCGEPMGVALLGRLKGDAEAPRQGVFDRTPCDKCRDLMAKGIMFIEVRDGEHGKDEPYRTGRIAVVTEQAVRVVLGAGELLDAVLAKRVTFIEESAAKELGLHEAMQQEGDDNGT